MIVARRKIWAVLALALAVAGLCLAPSSSWAIDIKLLPEKTEIVLTVNLKQILNSELAKSKNVQDVIGEIKAAFNQIPGNDQVLMYLEKMGLDPAKDLTRLTLAHPANKSAEDLFLLVEGNFNPAKIEAAAGDAIKNVGDYVSIGKLDNVTVIEISTGQGRAYVGLLGTKTIVATGTQAALKDAIARAAGQKPAALKKDVADMLATFHDKQSISFAASGRAMSGLDPGGAIGPVLPALNGGATGSITFAKEVNFQLGIVAKDRNTAEDLVDKGNLGLFVLRTLAAQHAQQNAQLAPLVDVANSLRVTNVGTNVVLTGEVSYEALQRLFKSFGQLPKNK